MATQPLTRRHLAHRSAGGTEVSLFWTKIGDTLTVEIHDTRSSRSLALELPRQRALDAFRRPYAYLAAVGVSRHHEQPLAA
jgi:hypothetical protein